MIVEEGLSAELRKREFIVVLSKQNLCSLPVNFQVDQVSRQNS